jgi:hypothetical protein
MRSQLERASSLRLWRASDRRLDEMSRRGVPVREDVESFPWSRGTSQEARVARRPRADYYARSAERVVTSQQGLHRDTHHSSHTRSASLLWPSHLAFGGRSSGINETDPHVYVGTAWLAQCVVGKNIYVIGLASSWLALLSSHLSLQECGLTLPSSGLAFGQPLKSNVRHLEENAPIHHPSSGAS